MRELKTSGAFVGREAELGRLKAALDQARNGHPGLLLVTGEAGVGKTRLIREFLARPASQSAWTALGICIDGAAESLPYGPLREAMRSLRRTIEDQASGKLASALAGLDGVGESASSPESYELSRGSLQLRQFEGLLDSIGVVGRVHPLMIVVEDLHWADLSTLACLSFLVTYLATERVLLIATYRSDELHRRHRLRPWIADQLRRASVELVELPRLTRTETQQLTAALAAEPLPAEFSERIFERSEGNAFFVEALTKSWTDGSDRKLPSSLREVLRSQMLPLSNDALAVLRVAAIGGRLTRPEIIAAILEGSDIDVFQALRDAVDHHILTASPEVDAFVFRHALLHEIVLADVVPGERERLHAAHAEELERRLSEAPEEPGALALLAYHWREARVVSKGIEFGFRAGETATAVGAFADALEQYDRVLSLWDAVPEAERLTGTTRAEMFRRAGSAAYLAGQVDRAIALVKAALEETPAEVNPAYAAMLHEMIGWINFERGWPVAAFDALEKALSLVPPKPSAERARILATSARLWMLWGQALKAKQLAEQAIEVARAAGSHHGEILALNPLGIATAQLGDPQRGMELLERAVAESRKLGDFDEETRAYINLGEIRLRSGDARGAVKSWRRGYERACRQGLREHGTFLLCNVAQGLYESGDWVGAERALEESRPWIPLGFAEMVWHTQRAQLCVGRGDFDEARKHLEHAAPLVDEGGNPEVTLQLCLVRAELAMWDARTEVVFENVEKGLAAVAGSVEEVRGGSLLMLELRALADRAQEDRVLRPTARGDSPGRAAALVAAATTVDWNPLEPSSGLFDRAVASTCRAELARVEGRLDPKMWAGAAEQWASWGAPYDAAYARFREAEAHAEQGDRLGAESALRAGHEIAVKLRAKPLLHEIKMLARRARVNLSPPLPEDEPEEASPAEQLGLTERETEVLRQLTMGRSNREIATALYISPKTASVHVSNIMRKLNAPSRLAAASIAHRMGLVQNGKSEAEGDPEAPSSISR